MYRCACGREEQARAAHAAATAQMRAEVEDAMAAAARQIADMQSVVEELDSRQVACNTVRPVVASASLSCEFAAWL